MRSLTKLLVLLVLFMATGTLVLAQGTEPAANAGASATGGATKAEVDQLRGELAAQRQTIEELKALVQQLAEAKSNLADADVVRANQTAGDVRLLNANLVEQEKPAQAPADKKPAEKKSEAPLIAGWNGEHFFIKSADGKFQIQPYGYFQTDYDAYNGDGAPSDTFIIRRARMGFQGNYGTHYDFSFLLDAAASNGISLRDAFVNIKPKAAFQFQAGQWKVPFAQEAIISDINIDFVERSLASLLYPNANATYRSPGAAFHGDLSGGIFQYWVGAFNGKGILLANTTNEPEILGHLRIYPWKKRKGSLFEGLTFGGSIARGRTRGLSGEQSFSGQLPDNVYNFFPSFRVNGPTERYEGELTWVHGPWAVRSEYVQLNQFRRAVGSETSDSLGFVTLPGIVAKAGYVQATYLITGETRPESGSPKIKHPFLGPTEAGGKPGWGAFELAFRYDSIQAHELGIDLLNNPITPGFVPTFIRHTDQYTGGLNWYLNNWIKYQANVSIDRLKEPSTTGQVPQTFVVLLNRLQFKF